MTELNERQRRLNDKYMGRYITLDSKFLGICHHIEAFGSPSGSNAFYVVHLHRAPSVTVYNTRKLRRVTAEQMLTAMKEKR